MIASLEKNNNELRNMNAIYTTVALFTVELFCEDTLYDFVRLVLSFQDLAITSTVLTPAQKIHLHVIALCLFVLITYCMPVLKEYSDKVSEQENRSEYFCIVENFTLIQSNFIITSLLFVHYR